MNKKNYYISEIIEMVSFQRNLFYPISIPMEPLSKQQRTNILYSLHEMNLKTITTIQYLIDVERVQDIFALCRQIFETTVNMGILAKQIIDDDLNKYLEYDYFQINKGNNHIKQLDLENFVQMDVERVKEIDDMVVAIKIKRNYRGFPQSWTNTDLRSRTKLLDENYDSYVNDIKKHLYEYLYCQIYRAASQVLHATPAGFLKMYEFNVKSKTDKRTVYNLKRVEGILESVSLYAIIIFLSSIRFFGIILENNRAESYFKTKIEEYFSIK